ncbi:MAG: membrane protein insertion efficiency factor YidD [Gammaproteobacteria bacterium]|nr:MAG: membrane protein insertion efficiency factor YidD [Gammaproteobacteria bacterium]RLA14361.1 MAG: membrane protein insertion efficiency factor YidD [Gammaproteobacteria bacterium]RLA15117.1 MAG: membrane protein insertion efficiency factor YidD [Gammaproteobacteria bacterium]
MLTVLVVGYRYFLSPWFGNNCRFTPTCSDYCLQCLQRFSATQAMWFTLKRISRCHPWSTGGLDPIPK